MKNDKTKFIIIGLVIVLMIFSNQGGKEAKKEATMEHYQEDANSYSREGGTFGENFLINYNLLDDILSMTWKVKIQMFGSVNYPIPSICWSGKNVLQLKITAFTDQVIHQVGGYCFDGTSWNEIFYQEAPHSGYFTGTNYYNDDILMRDGLWNEGGCFFTGLWNCYETCKWPSCVQEEAILWEGIVSCPSLKSTALSSITSWSSSPTSTNKNNALGDITNWAGAC